MLSFDIYVLDSGIKVYVGTVQSATALLALVLAKTLFLVGNLLGQSTMTAEPANWRPGIR